MSDEKHIEEEVFEDAPSEDMEIEDIEEAEGDKLKSLRDKLRTCDEEKRGHLEELQRTKADFLNSKRRLEEQLTRDKERITEKHVGALLPLADSFDMAMADPSWESCDEKWRKGIEGVFAQLQGILKGYGVEKVGAKGEEFNPEMHEAVSSAPGEEGKVVDVLQAGYAVGDRIIRPAKVIVGVTG